MDLVVPYEDEHLLVVDKPAGLVVHPAPGHARGTLVHGLLALRRRGRRRARAAGHRAPARPRHVRACSSSRARPRRTGALQELVQARELTREYLALVVGRPRSRSGTIDAPIGRDRNDPLRHSLDTDTPRDAVTHFEVEELLARHALLRVTLETGRTHQIRVHLDRDRPAGRRRPDLRPARRARARAAVPPCRAACVRASAHRASRWTSRRRCRRSSRRRLLRPALERFHPVYKSGLPWRPCGTGSHLSRRSFSPGAPRPAPSRRQRRDRLRAEQRRRRVRSADRHHARTSVPASSRRGRRTLRSSRTTATRPSTSRSADGTGAAAVGAGRWPSWSPSGDRLAVVRYDGLAQPDKPQGTLQLWVIGIAQPGEQQLTFGTTDVVLPAWSPDGTRIAFGTKDGLYTIGLDGTLPQPVLISAQVNGGPSWSPDGARLAFVGVQRRRCGSSMPTGRMRGRSPTRCRARMPGAAAARPAWSPDGQSIAWFQNADLCTTDLNGDVRRLTFTPQSAASRRCGPAGLAADRRGVAVRAGRRTAGANDLAGCDLSCRRAHRAPRRERVAARRLVERSAGDRVRQPHV